IGQGLRSEKSCPKNDSRARTPIITMKPSEAYSEGFHYDTLCLLATHLCRLCCVFFKGRCSKLPSLINDTFQFFTGSFCPILHGQQSGGSELMLNLLFILQLTIATGRNQYHLSIHQVSRDHKPPYQNL
ncbi:MAG: hypothetical protein K0R55_4167, partial [Sporomusa sp.]|nr:hypothetical protein [Sporomusa sp.]